MVSFPFYADNVDLTLLSDFFRLQTTSKGASGNRILMSGNGISLIFGYGCSYVLWNGHSIYLEDMVMEENGKLVLTDDSLSKILDAMSNSKIKYFYADNEIYVEEQKEISPPQKEISENFIYEIKPEKIVVNAIVIDAGHGGNDPGAFRGRLLEKNITLQVAKKLEILLQSKYPKKKIIMTRKEDSFVSLDKRSEIANNISKKYGTSIFVSIHVNASKSPKAYGFETWYIVDNYKRNVIEKNRVSNDEDINSILNSMINEELYSESRNLAHKIQKSLNQRIGTLSKNRGVKENTYIVVKNSFMPAVLIEIGFLSNKYEANQLTNDAYLNKLAAGILDGIGEFVNEYETTFGVKE